MFTVFEKKGIIKYNQFRASKNQAGNIRLLIQHRIIKFTLISILTGKDIEEVRLKVYDLMSHCSGASRAGANGARAKLAFALRAVEEGTNVVIGHARYHIQDLLSGKVPCTRLGVNLKENA